MKTLTILTVIIAMLFIACEKENVEPKKTDIDTIDVNPILLIEPGIYTGENGEINITAEGSYYTMIYNGTTYTIDGIIDDFGTIIFGIYSGDQIVFSGVYKDNKVSLLNDIGEFIGDFIK